MINLTGWSQIMDSHTTMSRCITFQRLYKTVLWLQIFSILGDCFNQMSWFNRMTAVVLSLVYFRLSWVYRFLRRFISSKEIFWRLFLPKPPDMYTANQAERQIRKLGTFWIKWHISVHFREPAYLTNLVERTA